MQETATPSPAPVGARSSRLNTILSVVVWLLLVAVVAGGAYFGYTVWATNNAQNLSTPALRAIQEIRNRVQKSPNDVALRVRLGEALGSAGLYAEATTQLGQAIKLDPTHVGAYGDLGMIAMQQSDYAHAEQYFEKIVQLTASDQYANVSDTREKAFYYLGEVSLNTRQYDDAVGFFKAALRIKRDASDSYLELALAYKGLGSYDQEIKQLEVALAFDPSYAQAHYELGEAYLAKKDTINAAVNLRLAASLAPGADQPQEALAALGTEASWMDRARAALASGDTKTALDTVLVARALEPTDAAAAKLHGQIAVRKGDLKSAVSIYKEALKLAPKDPTIKAALARLNSK